MIKKQIDWIIWIFVERDKGKIQTETKKFDIQIIWFYMDIDGLVLVTCRFSHYSQRIYIV